MSDFIVFGEDWGGHPSSTQHLIKGLLTKHRVIWINSIGLRSPKLNKTDFKRLLSKGLRTFKTKHKTKNHKSEKNLVVANPRVIPFHGVQWVRCVNRWYLKRLITKLSKQHQFKDAILWISLPTAADMVGQLNEKMSIYYCCDDFFSLVGVDHDAVGLLEKELAAKVDVVFITNETLAEKFDPKKTHLLPHGVDYELFSHPKSRPPDLNQNGKIAGFYGSISAWLDVEMLATTAESMPDWNFVLIGDIATNVDILTRLPNVYFLGSKKHDQLPGYVQHFDAAMLPFKINEQIQACNPLKLREYLASGTPVVSTDFLAVRQYNNHIVIKKNAETFSEALTRAFFYRHKKEERQNSVINQSWSQRLIEIENILNKI